MHAEHGTAVGTGPFLVFVPDEISYADAFNAGQIIDWARPILQRVALIEVCQALAGELVAVEAILASPVCQLLAVLNSARYAGLRFECIVSAAARTWLSVPHVGPAEPAIDSAGSDQRWFGWACYYHVGYPDSCQAGH